MTTQLTFLGATGQVTGSCYLLEHGKQRVLLDCGLFQGSKDIEKQNEEKFAFDPASLDAVILSHAHLDHCGRIPKLVKEGFRGTIYLTEASFPLVELLLKDAVHIQLKDLEWENKRRARMGKKPKEPFYDMDDVETTLDLRLAVKYGEEINITNNINFSFHDGGHILGSAIVRVKITGQHKTKTIVFSGDLGNSHSPLLKDPAILEEADVLLLESTYGDRNHKPLEETLNELRATLNEAAQNSGNIIIPSFALGRTQDVLYWLGRLQRNGELPQSQIYVDSPMAHAASKIYVENTNLFNVDDLDFRKAIPNGWQTWLNGLHFTESAEDSMAINRLVGGVIIIAGSGMCNGGRIRHHLKHNIWRRNAHVVITGYQAENTLGRAIVESQQKKLKILDTEVIVAAKVHTLGALSAHADQSQLLQWAGHFKGKPELYLVHGEKPATLSLQTCFQRLNWKAHIPKVGKTIEI
ncbi:Ribonuclease [uncultured bacterium]|nr:Ribonuclease [uncultured bacterium]